MMQQDRINRLFAENPTLVYRNFRRGTIEINKARSMDEIEIFWKDTRAKKVNFNEKPSWPSTLKSEHYKKIKSKS